MVDHLDDPQAISWEDLRAEFGFTDAEQRRIAVGAKRLIAQSRARRLVRIIAERSSSVTSATGSLAADGLMPTAEAAAILDRWARGENRWARGEIGTVEMRAEVRRLHGITEPAMPLTHPDAGGSA